MTEGVLLRSVIVNCTILLSCILFMIAFLFRFWATNDPYWVIATVIEAVLAVFILHRLNKLAVQQVP
jgi:hypothetical protein